MAKSNFSNLVQTLIAMLLLLICAFGRIGYSEIKSISVRLSVVERQNVQIMTVLGIKPICRLDGSTADLGPFSHLSGNHTNQTAR